MPFKDTKEGSTHHHNDGCGEPEHNDMPLDKKNWKEKFDESFLVKYSDGFKKCGKAYIDIKYKTHTINIIDFISQVEQEAREDERKNQKSSLEAIQAVIELEKPRDVLLQVINDFINSLNQ